MFLCEIAVDREVVQFLLGVLQGRSEVRWRPGQGASSAPPCSNLMSFGSKCTVLMNVLATLLRLIGAPSVVRRPGNCDLLAPPRYATGLLLLRPSIQEMGYERN